jgi:hypothetical protein
MVLAVGLPPGRVSQAGKLQQKIKYAGVGEIGPHSGKIRLFLKPSKDGGILSRNRSSSQFLTKYGAWWGFALAPVELACMQLIATQKELRNVDVLK